MIKSKKHDVENGRILRLKKDGRKLVPDGVDIISEVENNRSFSCRIEIK